MARWLTVDTPVSVDGTAVFFCLSKYDEVAQDHDLLADLLSDGPPQLMFVRSSPRWAGL